MTAALVSNCLFVIGACCFLAGTVINLIVLITGAG